jgi:hypothetical protein
MKPSVKPSRSPTVKPTASTLSPTSGLKVDFLSFSTVVYKFPLGYVSLVINQATGARLLNLLEVAFSYGGVNFPSSWLTFTGSSYHNNINIVGGINITFGVSSCSC